MPGSRCRSVERVFRFSMGKNPGRISASTNRKVGRVFCRAEGLPSTGPCKNSADCGPDAILDPLYCGLSNDDLRYDPPPCLIFRYLARRSVSHGLDPSRSFSFAYGTALPAPTRTYPLVGPRSPPHGRARQNAPFGLTASSAVTLDEALIRPTRSKHSANGTRTCNTRQEATLPPTPPRLTLLSVSQYSMTEPGRQSPRCHTKKFCLPAWCYAKSKEGAVNSRPIWPTAPKSRDINIATTAFTIITRMRGKRRLKSSFR